MIAFARLAALALAMAPALVVAQAPGAEVVGKPYLALRAGVIIPQHDDLDGMDNGFSLEGAFGYRVHPNFALELTLGRWSMSGSASEYIPAAGQVNVKLEFVAYPVLVTAKAILPLDKVELYALLGAGVHFISATGDVSAPAIGRSASQSDSDSAFAFHVGAGLDFQVSPTAFLGAELKYIVGEATVFESTGHFDSLIIAGAVRFTL